jgi:hypothetical protein
MSETAKGWEWFREYRDRVIREIDESIDG